MSDRAMATPESVEVFSKDTFITSLRNGANTNAGSETGDVSRSEVEEPAAMAMVREKHAQLHEVVGSLSEKISAVLGRQEKDFLAAYRAHMYNVQKELHDLRERMQRNETVENKTEKIKKIEDERDWYRKEALRLDAFTTSMTKDLKYMREKLESIEEDRNWLEKQLKACKKQNKLLRAELDVRLSANTTSGVDASSSLPPFDSPKANTGAALTSKTRKLSHHPQRDGVGEDGTYLPQLGSSGDPAFPALVEEREEQFRKQIRALKKELQLKTHEVTALRRQRAFAIDTDDERSHLENFFLQCIESVKTEVVRRRNNAYGRKEREGGVRSLLSDKLRNEKQDVGAEFEDFASADRVRVIERLLAHDEVLTLLYGQLFPAKLNEERAHERPVSANGEGHHHHIPMTTMSSDVSTKSLPDAAVSPTSARRVGFENGNWSPAGKPAGSGAAVVSAVRSGNGLPIDESTRNYLRSMRLGT